LLLTAREMANLVRAAENGWDGDVVGARDFELLWNGAAGQGLSHGDDAPEFLEGGAQPRGAHDSGQNDHIVEFPDATFNAQPVRLLPTAQIEHR
jgi:hypothetical protein